MRNNIKLSVIVALSIVCGFLSCECFNTWEKIQVKEKLSLVENKQRTSVADIKKAMENKKTDHFNSKKFAITYTGKGEEREKRYGISSANITFNKKFLSWKGGKKISRKELETLCRQVFKKLPHIKTSNETINLVIETAIAESDGGRIVKGMGQDRGVFQIRIAAAKEQLAWLKKNHKDIFTAINNMRDANLSEEDNLIENVPYSLAMCITHYWRMAGSQYYKHIASLEKRAIMWKSTYNTKKGLGTVNAYIKRVNSYKG